MADQPDPEYLTPALAEWRRRTDGPLLVLAIGTLPFLLLELVRTDLPLWDRRLLDIVNVVVLVAFLVDYLVELRLASNRRVYARREWTSLLIVVAQAIAVIPALAGFGALRVLRGGRAVRALAAIFRILAIGGASAREGRTVLRRRAGTFALSLAGLTWITGAACFALAEGVGEDGRVGSVFDALWWSAMTITTIGYGDIAPQTAAGRVVAILTAVVGIGTFAILTAKMAEFLVRPEASRSAGSDAGLPTAGEEAAGGIVVTLADLESRLPEVRRLVATQGTVLIVDDGTLPPIVSPALRPGRPVGEGAPEPSEHRALDLLEEDRGT